MNKITSMLMIIIMSVVLITDVYASNSDVLNISTKNNIGNQSVEYNANTLLRKSDNKTEIVEENSIQVDANNINKEKSEMIFVLGGVLLAFTVATVYEINHD